MKFFSKITSLREMRKKERKFENNALVLCSFKLPLVVLGISSLPGPEDECWTILQLTTTDIEHQILIALANNLTKGGHGPPCPRLRYETI